MNFKEAVASATAVVSRRKVRTSTSEQQGWVRRWESSALSQQAFCDKYALNSKTFSNWLRKWRSKTLSGIHTPVLNAQDKSRLEVTLSNGIEMVLTGLTEERMVLAFMKGVSHANKA